MSKVSVILAPGFEEGESLTIVDILRRGGITCELVGLDAVVEGAHQIKVKCDQVLSQAVIDSDMIVLPGGRPGADHLRDSDLLMAILQEMDHQGKYIAAMCAAPMALERAGLLKDKNFTAYLGYEKKIKDGHFVDQIVVQDGRLITSRGPATVYAFSYHLLDVLGGDSLKVKKRMVYFNVFDHREDE